MAGTSGTPFSSAGGGTIPGPGDKRKTDQYWKDLEKDLQKKAKALKKEQGRVTGLKTTKGDKALSKLSKGQRPDLSQEGKPL
ncbi:MAG: hypothetical protein ACXABY_20395 [Candidatus Thorarchaeota archaeon]|jgi:hypothetical protein